MIRYALRCSDDHRFESWFQSADAFESLSAAGHLSCPVCGDTGVGKALMAPGVRPARNRADVPSRPAAPPAKDAQAADTPRPLSMPRTEVERAMAELRRRIEERSDYVGLNFASEARRMHEGELEHRPIHGEAKPEDAKKLLEDGVPVAPLPFVPRRKTN